MREREPFLCHRRVVSGTTSCINVSCINKERRSILNHITVTTSRYVTSKRQSSRDAPDFARVQNEEMAS